MYYSLTDGTKVKLEITNAKLLKFRSERPAEYDIYYKSYKNLGDTDKLDLIFDVLQIIYTGYICGKYGDDDTDIMTFEEFVELTPYDIEYNAGVAADLVSAKKVKASAKPSERLPKSEKTEA